MTNDKNKFKEAVYNYSGADFENAKELTPESLRDFVISYEKKFEDNLFSKDRLACFSILKKILEDEKDRMERLVFNKLPEYFEDPDEANNYDEITDVYDDEIQIYGFYRDRHDSCYDKEYTTYIPIEFLLDPDASVKRQEMFKLKKEQLEKEQLEKKEKLILKKESEEKELFLKLKEKYENDK